MFKIGDIVVFGRPNGEQTRGRVLRVNERSLTIEQLEARGQTRTREAGAKWRVHPSLVKLESGASAPVATSKRPDAEILKDLREVWAQIENIHCDGERSESQIKAAQRRLDAKRGVLVKELGRQPAPNEIWSVA
jgi:hypothetical protein